MSTQIFKSEVPQESFFSFLDKICTKTDKFYVFNNCAYKKGNLLDVITPFLEECKPHYHLSKLKYIEKKLTYNSLTTILRQICNFIKVRFTSQIKYEKSTYNIIYYFYF